MATSGNKLGSLFTHQNMLIAAVAAGAFALVLAGTKKDVDETAKEAAEVTRAYAVTTTHYGGGGGTGTDGKTVTADSMKNTIMSNIYSAAINPSVVLTNLEAIKSEVNTYTSKLTLLIGERAAGRINSFTIAYYLRTIAEEIMKKLNIEFRPGTGGGAGGGGGGGGDGYVGIEPWLQNPWGGYVPGEGWYSPPGYGGGGLGWAIDPYSQYLQYLQQMQQYQNQYQNYANQYQQYGYPNYGYSYGYGYQTPQVYAQSPLQTYNYYPQYAAGAYPQSSVTNMYGYGGYGGY